MRTMKEEFEQTDGTQFPGKTFMDELLKPMFYDQKEHLFAAMFSIHKAHTTMLSEQGILTKEEAEKILYGVQEIEQMDIEQMEYSSRYEDLFFFVESKIGELIGDELAGKCTLPRVEMIWVKQCTVSSCEAIFRRRWNRQSS
ncbi:hypothetical protein [Litoribacterium kuwaitense]|uniref:hypothetical protein n=1 Tax=Litoribacterium kuwaitense TaxID=1398745 RepID=UPI001FE6A4AE|nr:hypothetical protein [Litoribacterium kuwaitense]